jgi:predicted amidohydrolase YtcJ
VEVGYWGAERVAALFPAREWLDQGALVTAGSDFPVGQFGVMRSVWGMTTRQTVIGVQGPEHAITYDEAVALHTTHAARLLGEDHLRGTLTVGRFADLTVWDTDPARIPGDALRDLNPSHTIIGGLIVHSPEPAGSSGLRRRGGALHWNLGWRTRARLSSLCTRSS